MARKLLVAGCTAAGLFATGTPLWAEEAAVQSTRSIPTIWWVAPFGSLVALGFALMFYFWMKKQNPGEPEMVKIAGYVKKGAMAYLKQQYKVVAIVFVIISILLSIMAFGLGVQSVWVPFAFLTGGFFSGLCGYLGMLSATEASSRTAFAAKDSLNKGLKVAFRSGAVMGLIVVGFGLVDICLWFLLLYKGVPALHQIYPNFIFFQPMELKEITVVMLCFGMGASTQALFARVGGGIFTKAADVGADLVGKVEAGIPEDDPRNPAVIADNVGDNVGDVAGMGADLYESYCGSILASAALGAATALSLNADPLPWVILPMIIAGIGNFLSIIGIYAVSTKEKATQKDLMASLFRGINLSSLLIVIFSAFAVFYILKDVAGLGNPVFMGVSSGAIGIWLAIVVGLVVGIIIGKSTEYYTSSDYKPTQLVAEQTQTGPATTIISGMALGMLSTAIPVISIGIGMMLSYGLSGGFTDPIRGLYGIGLASVGMLSTLGITLATDAYGPIADNAGGNAQMTNQPAFVRERTDALDSLGNTTAATGKGFAIGSAALTALALLAAYIEEIRIGLERAGTTVIQIGSGAVNVAGASLDNFMEFFQITLMNPKVLVGAFIGSMLAFAFAAMSMKAVGRAAGRMVQEVRRQFKEIKGLLEGKAEADYTTCVSIATKGAQTEMILPASMALIAPVAVGLLLGVPGVMGMLVGGLSTGFVLAVMMANSGGAWDNAKKYIESGQYGGKGSFCHKAGVVGDTVGDPFKDTAGPSLNILIKLMSMVSVVFAGLTVKYAPQISQWLGMN
ncbi:MAG: sodium-translocating pyrophosphatase [Planctomycetes bacterium]|nr:sodium-translocating pyrophosphatase [Planctomycetota bacterium]